MNRRDFFTLPIGKSGRTSSGRLAANGNGVQRPVTLSRAAATGLEPYTGPWTYVQAKHLLNRAMIGPTDAEIKQAVSDGMDATITKILTGFTPTTTEIDSFAGKDPQVIPPAQTDPAYTDFQKNLQSRHDLLERWWLRVMATSPVSIQERMVLFWHNHFVSDIPTVNFAEFMYGQNDLFRKNFLGNFKQFVKDVTKDVSMLLYLDGAKNYKTGNRNNINENYGRELQELFTMGPVDWSGNPNYSQTDVSEAARALSGYTLAPSASGASYFSLTSQFVPSRWDSGSKTYLGQTGAWKADDVVDIIFAQRGDQVAKFICEKLYRNFVYDIDTTDHDVIAAMAETMKANNWELKPVMNQLLHSAHFYDTTNIGDLEKGPVEFMVGAIRQLGLTNVPDFINTLPVRIADGVYNLTSSLGQGIFYPPNVKGWPGGRTWISTSTLPPRQKLLLDIMDGKVTGPQKVVYYQFDAVAWAGALTNINNPQGIVTAAAALLLNTAPSQNESDMLLIALLDGEVAAAWPSLSATDKATRIKLLIKSLVQLAKYQLY